MQIPRRLDSRKYPFLSHKIHNKYLYIVPK
jgi:hypothetical protein